MGELAQHIISISGKNLDVKYQTSSDPDYLTDNPQRRCPSIDKAEKLLHYTPKISLEDGLMRTYKYYLDHPIAEEL